MHTRWIFIFLRGIELYSRFFSRFQIPEWNEIHIIAWISFPKIRYYPYRISITFPQSIKFSKRFERSARGKKTLHIGRTQETTWAEIKWTSPRSFDEWKVCQVLSLEPRMFRSMAIRSRAKCQERWALSSITRPVITRVYFIGRLSSAR